MNTDNWRQTALAVLVAAALMLSSCATPPPVAPYPAALLGGLARWHLTLPTSEARLAFPADLAYHVEHQTWARLDADGVVTYASPNAVP